MGDYTAHFRLSRYR